MDRPELWAVALGDAGYTADEAVWREVPGGQEVNAEGRLDNPNWSFVQTAGPNDEFPIWFPGGQKAYEWGIANHGKVRVLLYEKPSGEPETVALMRWALERARLYQAFPAAFRLIQATHLSHENRIHALGPGGAVYHHQAPEQRQANAAASRLVVATFGEQLGKLHHALGSLFRGKEDALPDDVFEKRAVAFAAFHADDLEAAGFDVESLLDQLIDGDAREWFERLAGDGEFQALRAAAPVLSPTAEQTAESDYAVALWQQSALTLRKAEDRALAIL